MMHKGGIAAAVSCIVSAFDEELAILRAERDAAVAAAAQAAGNARHWQANHADLVARCALLRERPDLPAERLPAYRELVRLQAEVTLLKGTLDGVAEDRDRWQRYARQLEQDSEP